MSRIEFVILFIVSELIWLAIILATSDLNWLEALPCTTIMTCGTIGAYDAIRQKLIRS